MAKRLHQASKTRPFEAVIVDIRNIATLRTMKQSVCTAMNRRRKNDLFAGVVLAEHLDADRQNSNKKASSDSGSS